MRGKAEEGALVSILLGPIGWAMTIFSPDWRRRCPVCRSRVNNGRETCPRCGNDVPEETEAPGQNEPVERTE